MTHDIFIVHIFFFVVTILDSPVLGRNPIHFAIVGSTNDLAMIENAIFKHFG